MGRRPADVGPHIGDRRGRSEGVTGGEAVDIARAFAAADADLIDVSAGQTWVAANPVYGQWVPPQHLSGMAKLARTLAREAELRAAEVRA